MNGEIGVKKLDSKLDFAQFRISKFLGPAEQFEQNLFIKF